MRKSMARLQQRCLAWGSVIVCFFLLLVLTPRIRQPSSFHKFADQRNLIGVPNTLNVISNFPFLIVGVVGLVLCLHGNNLSFSLKGEAWGWACFYAGVTATAFGSAYYHIKPNDERLVWDHLPMVVAFSSLMAVFINERIDERRGTFLLFPFLLAGIISVAYWRFADDLRLYVLVQLTPCILIPTMTITLPSKYTHSSYWLWSSGCYLLAKLEEAMDKKIYRWTNYGVSGHTLRHLCSFMLPLLITIMLARRNNMKVERQSFWEKWKTHLRNNQEDKSLPQSRNFGERTLMLQDDAERLSQP